jgi:hypothetical protein
MLSAYFQTVQNSRQSLEISEEEQMHQWQLSEQYLNGTTKLINVKFTLITTYHYNYD